MADTWDPNKDDASGDRCKAYGAPALLRQPGHLHITWQDDRTLKLENKKDGKTVVTGKVAVSKDGKSRTLTVSGKDAAGKKVSSTAVYDKE